MTKPFTPHLPPSTPQAKDMRSALNAALVALAMREPDPVERKAKLDILRKDGWL